MPEDEPDQPDVEDFAEVEEDEMPTAMAFEQSDEPLDIAHSASLSRIQKDVENGRVLASQVVTLRRETEEATPANKPALVKLFNDAREAFIGKHGAFRKETYFLDSTGMTDRKAALLYTEDCRIHIWVNRPLPEAAELEQLIYQLDRLSDEVLFLQPGRPRDALQDRIANACLSILNSWFGASREPRPFTKETLEGIKELAKGFAGEVEYVQRLYERLLVRQSKTLYLIGTMTGLLAVITVWVAAWQNPWDNRDPSEWEDFAAALLIFGAVGTAVSVMTRLGRDQVRPDVSSGFHLMLTFGYFRPLVGGTLGAILYLFVVGEWVPLKLPEDPSLHSAFFVGGAFLVGFSERVARDMMVVAGRRLDASEEKEGKTE